MLKNSKKTEMVLLLLSLIIPLGGASFLLNIILTIIYIPSIQTMVSTEIDTALRIFVPFVLYLVALAFSIIVLTGKPKEKVLPILSLTLNSILVFSGIIYLASTYLM